MTSDKYTHELSQQCPDFTLSVCMLASGSKGNATYISDGATSILIDAGLSGITVEKSGTKIGIATDLGIATLMVKEHLKECALLILEANHDPGMLINGPYPWPLKQRIKSRTGHLSNDDSATLLKELLHDRLCHVVLAHLSETNNTPEKALSTVGNALNNCKTRLDVATQDMCTNILYLK